jgi:hypothetical protein
MGDYNGDLKLVAHQLGEMNVKIDKLDTRLETNIEVNNDRLREGEKQSALHALSLEIITDKVESLDSDVKRISLVSKVIGGITGGLAVVAAAIGINK